MSRSQGRSLWVLAVTVVFAVGACAGGASPGASTAASAGASTAASASAAASGANASAVTGAACAQNATVVNFWTSHTPPDSDVIKGMVDTFNQANADICVKMTIVKGSETDTSKLQTAIRGGVAPDVYEVDRFIVAQRAQEGVVEDITAEVGNLKDQYLDFAWAETQFEGKTFALPFDTDARALWYNKDLVTAAGGDLTKLDMTKGPPTIADVTAIADKISKKTGDNYDVMGWIPGGPGAGGQPGAFDQGWHYTWGFDYGGKFADLAACKVTPTDPGVVAGYQFMYDWQKAHNPTAVSRWVSTNNPPNAPAASNPFWTGKLGMTISGDWRIAEQAKYAPNGHYGFTFIPVPKAGDKATTWAGGWSMALIPGSKARAQAIKFIEFMDGPDGSKIYTKQSTHLSPLKALQTDDSLYDPQHKVFLGLLPTALSRPPLAVGAYYWDQLTSAQGSVELNTKQPQAALQEVQDKVQAKLDQVKC